MAKKAEKTLQSDNDAVFSGKRRLKRFNFM